MKHSTSFCAKNPFNGYRYVSLIPNFSTSTLEHLIPKTMKSKSFLLFTFLTWVIFTKAQFTPSCVPHNGLQAYWPLDIAYTGNDSWAGTPGTVYGASLAPDRFGNPNRAYYFNGTTDSIITLYAGVLGAQARAVSFWAKSAGASPAVGMYAVTWGSSNPGERFGCGIDYPSGCTSAGAAYCTAAHPMLGTGTSNNAWHHYVFQFSGIAPNNTVGSIQIYQDAVLVGPTTPSTTPGSSSVDEGTIINTMNTGGFNVRFGKANYPMTQSLLTGYLDDIGIWDRMLDTCEIKRL